MDEWKRSGQIPAFGNWELAKDMPITQYFECARQAGVVRHSSSSGDSDRDDLKNKNSLKKRGRNRERENVKVKVKVKESARKQQGKGKWDYWDVDTHSHNPNPPPPKPLDEDLYKIPPELLHSTTANTNRSKMLRFISNCLLPTACHS